MKNLRKKLLGFLHGKTLAERLKPGPSFQL